MGGFSAQMAAATGGGLATFAAEPISIMHAIAGGLAGVGTSHNWRGVRWVSGKCIVYAWILTFPGAALVGVASYLSIHLLLEPPVRG
jgi:PiT family inorganic phosphate transporter